MVVFVNLYDLISESCLFVKIFIIMSLNFLQRFDQLWIWPWDLLFHQMVHNQFSWVLHHVTEDLTGKTQKLQRMVLKLSSGLQQL